MPKTTNLEMNILGENEKADFTKLNANFNTLDYQVGDVRGMITIHEPFEGSTSITKTFTENMRGFLISNDGNADLTFTINGATLTVKAGEVFDAYFGLFNQVTINTTVPYRAYGKGATSQTIVVEPDTTPPNEVTNLQANPNLNSIFLTWTASNSSDITSYEVYNGSTLLDTITGTSFNVTGLIASTQYTFTVKSKDASDNVSSGVSVTSTTTDEEVVQDITPPEEVTNLVHSNLSQNSLTLSWNASVSSDILEYDIHKDGVFLVTTSLLTYNVSGLNSNQEYTFTVKAKDNSNNISTGVNLIVTTLESALSNVTNLQYSNLAETTLTLTWSASSEATSYDIEKDGVLLENIVTTSYNVTSLTGGTQYTFTVKAKNSVGVSNGTNVIVTTSNSAGGPQEDNVNLFVKSAATPDKAINTSTGELIDLVGTHASDYIELENRQVYNTLNLAASTNRVYYDTNKVYTSNASQQGIFVGSTNRNFIRLTVPDANLDTFSIFKTGIINLIDPSLTIQGKALSTSDGSIIDNASYSVTDWIDVTNGETYTLSQPMGHRCEYDIDKVFIKSVTNTEKEQTVDQNTKFVRLTIPTVELNESFWHEKI